MKNAMKARALKAGLALLLVAVAAPSAAQGYPDRALRWVVPYPAGGYADAVTRTVAPRLQQALGQPVVVDNRPGANSILGAEHVARSTPDGYVMLSVIVGHAVNATLYADRMPYDAVRSFTPVSLLATAPLMFAVKDALPVRNIRELIAYARANPGKLSYGSSGVGAGAHLSTELFRLNESIDIVHIPYKGGAPAVQALVAGEIDILVDVPSVLMPHVRAGRVRALGVLSARRIAGLEDVPTLAEVGAKPIEGATWVMVLVPAGTPAANVNRLSGELRRVIAADDVRERFSQLGTQPVGGTPDEAARFLADEIGKWKRVIVGAGIKADP